jgi:hypothetical protein
VVVIIPVVIEKKVHAPITEFGNWVSIEENFAANTIIGKLTRQAYCQNLN